FTINNPEKNAVPEFQLIEFADIIRESTTNINWISEDADNSELIITIEHSINPDDSFQKIYESTHSNGDNSFLWDLSLIPNYDENYLRFTCKDDQNETIFRTSKFVVNIEKGLYSSSHVEHISGKSTPKIEVIVVEPEMITNDDYEITFNVEEEINRYSVQNLTTSEILIDNFELINGMSSTTFEGLRLSIVDNDIDINYELTHFNRIELEATYNVYFSLSNSDYIGNPHVKSAIDWIVVFNDLDTNADGSWINVGDSTPFFPSMNDGICPFRIVDNDNSEKANYLVDKSNNSTSIQSQWHEDDIIILRPQDASDATVSYALEFDFSSGDFPQKDDTLYIVTYNPIENVDVFRFRADSNYVLSNDDKLIIPIVYTLSQNYPNPFNPVTTIRYSIPVAALSAVSEGMPLAEVQHVTLTVYDILGREVAALVDKGQKAGIYEVTFDGSNLTSGVYFYRLSSGSFVKSMKMILLK
ncbi:MAG: T9SS type A sorting domain-containing protein, partial [Melioribacteraceae bacterium]|nr:T9SS type A sorting domain-containing protein [Melioribacteraceae bacterium]